MKLDERVKKDLSELYNGGNTPGEIQCAVELEGLIAAKPGQTSFATKALPGYYAGNRKADTVLVMLNPGMSVCEANCRLMYDIERYSMKDANDIENYHQCCANYGYIDKSRLDNFDLKQAFFLHNWEQTGIELPIDLRSTMTRKSDMGTLLKAKEAVLTQKLQLELVPYASSSFNNINKSKIKLLIPFVETLFDEIFAHERKYVIFCSHIFIDSNLIAYSVMSFCSCLCSCVCVNLLPITYHSYSTLSEVLPMKQGLLSLHCHTVAKCSGRAP